MNMEPIPARGDELEAVLRATPGVVNVYPAEPLVTTVLRTGAHVLGLRDDVSPVLIQQHDDRTHITVSIGIHAAVGAADTALVASEAITSLFASRGLPRPEIHLTIAQIAENPLATAQDPE